jgi:hypothetical protein
MLRILHWVSFGSDNTAERLVQRFVSEFSGTLRCLFDNEFDSTGNPALDVLA